MLLLLLTTAVYVGNSVCADCHRNIARRFEQTAMARAATCERCHGPGSVHAKGSGRMIVPSALEPSARDSVCAQCHLKGAVQVNRLGKSPKQFRPGGELTTFVATFVREPAAEPSSHVESLAASRCRQPSGATLWCGACHDVHDGSTNRDTCAQCHATRHCGRGPDCISCHMPKRTGASVPTDHSMSIRPRAPQPAPPLTALRPFTRLDDGVRELGLAYAAMAGNDPRLAAEAERLLSTLRNPDRQVRKYLRRKPSGAK